VLYFLVCCVVLAIGAFWELLEWWTTLLVAADVGDAFLGSQAIRGTRSGTCSWPEIGAALAQPLLGRFHDASMARVAGG
jgi:putative membrane protein